MEDRKVSLREFFVSELGNEVAASSVDRTERNSRITPNTVEGFVVETNQGVSDDAIHEILRKYFDVPADHLIVRCEGFVWIVRDDQPKLLAVFQNLRDLKQTSGARFFGGSPNHGGIEVNLTRHDMHA